MRQMNTSAVILKTKEFRFQRRKLSTQPSSLSSLLLIEIISPIYLGAERKNNTLETQEEKLLNKRCFHLQLPSNILSFESVYVLVNFKLNMTKPHLAVFT